MTMRISILKLRLGLRFFDQIAVNTTNEPAESFPYKPSTEYCLRRLNIDQIAQASVYSAVIICTGTGYSHMRYPEFLI